MKFLVLVCSLILILAFFILQPQQKAESVDVNKTKEFGEFLSTHGQVSANVKGEIEIVASPVSKNQASEHINSLTREQAKMLEEDTASWGKPEFIRNDRFRSQMANILDLAEKTHSLAILDKVRAQIIAAGFDENSQIAASSQAWMEQYLKLETRENYIQQMREVRR